MTGETPHLLFDPEKVLYMMAELMSNHIGLRKIRIAAAETSELVPETQVDINLFVSGTVERSAL
jgi:hypothetical protein